MNPCLCANQINCTHFSKIQTGPQEKGHRIQDESWTPATADHWFPWNTWVSPRSCKTLGASTMAENKIDHFKACYAAENIM